MKLKIRLYLKCKVFALIGYNYLQLVIQTAYDILWNGTYIYINDYAPVSFPYVKGGYKYTAGSLMKNTSYCWLG